MPVISNFVFPNTSDPSEFEDIVTDICNNKFDGDFIRYGRSGQKQNGIDIISQSSDNFIGVQCKNYALKLGEVNNIVKQADEFKPGIDKLIIAVGSSRDAKIQNLVSEINRSKEYRFTISMLFWDEIEAELGQNDELCNKYYPSIYQSRKRDKLDGELISSFNMFVKKYSILDYVRVDPIIGMPMDLVVCIDSFYDEISYLLDDNITLQKSATFIAIKDFKYAIYEYCGYLSKILFPATTMYTIQNPYDRKDISRENSKIQGQISEYKEKLDEIYSKINTGCSLYI